MLLPASAFLLVLSEPVVRLVFQRGEFDAREHVAHLRGARVLRDRPRVQRRQPARDPRVLQPPAARGSPTKVAALGVVLNAALDAVLYQPLGTGGIPLATSLSSIVTFLIMLLAARPPARRPPRGLGGRRRGPQRRGERRLRAARLVHLAGARRRARARRRSPRSSASGRRSRPRRSPTSPPRRRSRCASCGPWARLETAATMRDRGPGTHPQLLHHRPHRPRQVDAGGPHPPAHRRGGGARHAQPGARLDGPRARARHHHQGPGRAGALHGRRTARPTSST